MALNDILLWIAGLSSASGLIGLVRARAWHSRRWFAIHALILAATLVGWWWLPAIGGYLAGGLWALLVLPPMLGTRWIQQEIERQRFGRALWIARVLGWLHPPDRDGWRERLFLLEALERMQQGDAEGAQRLLLECQASGTPLGRHAQMQLWRLSGRWEDIVSWGRTRLRVEELWEDPTLGLIYLRALGETGRLDELGRLFRRLAPLLDRARPGASSLLDGFYLYLSAFAGRTAQVEAVLHTRLAGTPESTRRLWRATAEIAAGRGEAVRGELEALCTHGDHLVRMSAAARLKEGTPPPILVSPEVEAVLAEIERRLDEEERYGGTVPAARSPWVTYVFIGLNLLVFGLEVVRGGSTDERVLYELGAFVPEAVRAGEWWRLLSSTFLHAGPVHLGLNLMGLYILGRPVEVGLGPLRYAVVYVVSGLSGGLVALGLDALGWIGPRAMVGASGCVMGLVGANLAIFLRGWRRDRSQLARHRLRETLSLLGLQVVFDLLTPQVSLLAHASGVGGGFLMTLLVGSHGSEPAAARART
ncbi:MAG TPA: rhomboid family intramembrane serine protease [Polyangia bacterium]|nr:rhomboid family intramembrane serine protease [Polyangia bacterium]